MVYKKILYFHLPVLIILLTIQYFSIDIYAYTYLNSVKKQFNELRSNNVKIYQNGEYVPILKKDPYSHFPRDPKLVIVKKDQNLTKEFYFTASGEEIEATYINDEIQRITGRSIPSKVIFTIPLFGLVLGLCSIIHEIFRTGELITWRLMRNPDSFEGRRSGIDIQSDAAALHGPWWQQGSPIIAQQWRSWRGCCF